MALLSVSSARVAPSSQPTDALTDLTRLLSRLQQTVLRSDAERERRLQTSEFERRKVGTNINHARVLLTKLEQEALTTKVHPRKQDLLADLNRKRELLEQLVERMHDLEEIGNRAAEEEEEEEDSSDGEDILAEIIATPSESMDSRSTDLAHDETAEQEEEADPEAEPIPALPDPEPVPRSKIKPEGGSDETQKGGLNIQDQQPPLAPQAETTTSSTLRSRTTNPSTAAPDTAETTALFGNRANQPVALTTTEAILDHQRREQDMISESILKMATDLKASSLSFSEKLVLDKDVVSRAGQGLDKNERGLEAAARRMGMLRRATEGKGWFGRIMLYLWIYGLMLVLVVVVFGLPKLRF